MERLSPLGMRGVCFNVADAQKFDMALRLLKESLAGGLQNSLFCSDNLITWNRNLTFLRDPFFLELLQGQQASSVEKSIVWRSYLLMYFAKLASSVVGDFVELGCHTGYTVLQVIKRLGFADLDKKYYLYDLFEWKEGDQHTLLEGHKNPNMYDDVLSKFDEFDFVEIVKGSVPESFTHGFPDTICFCHIDMNHPIPEVGALKEVVPRLSKGAVVVFDDYGWLGYSAQKLGLDPIAAAHGLEILELPTGQGLLIKP